MIDNIKQLKRKYEPEGFIVLGIFGSYARNEEMPESDIDILYKMTDLFYKKYPGWNAVSILEKINRDFEKKLAKKVDFADKNALKRVGLKYILPEVQYV